ncbi:hypothetical protein H8E88_28920 [candidate division KSB1 bacterium]|nr:hypothetical protein [candidate division KSB1 bacterium]MBL7093227.1 hypothetical protein [candidate division KSB1 bacterium]
MIDMQPSLPQTKTRISKNFDWNHFELLNELMEVAVNGLTDMYDSEQHLFCERVKRSATNVSKEGLSYRYSIISALGLFKYKMATGKTPVSIRNTLSKLTEQADKIDTIGDLGLLLWLCALVAPEQLEQLCMDLDVENALTKYKDAQQGLTVELSWFLAGLSHISLALDKVPSNWDNITIKTYELVMRNYYNKGLFGHSFNNNIAGRLRSKIGCFADQVYPIYALSTFAKALDRNVPAAAVDCGRTICQLQGTLGQWWWHYNAKSGRVIGRYPVFATHQNGMAPMALFALSEVSGLDFSDSILRGLKWIDKNNELGSDFIDRSRNVIWRSLYKDKYKLYLENILSLSGINRNQNNTHDLKINWECRPYHLGWILYAFAGK